MAQTTQPSPTIIGNQGEPVIAIPMASPAQIVALTALRTQAVATITSLELGTGCNRAMQTIKIAAPVKDFQNLWNLKVPTLLPLYASKQIPIGPLQTDGKFGPNTAAAMWLTLIDPTGLVQSDFPTHPCDMAMPAKEPVLDAVVARLQMRLVQALAASKPPKPVVKKPTPSKPVETVPVSKPATATQTDAAATVAQGKGGGTAIDVAPSSDVTFDANEVAPVAGTTSKGLSGWIYFGIGAGVFGIGFAWWKWGKK